MSAQLRGVTVTREVKCPRCGYKKAKAQVLVLGCWVKSVECSSCGFKHNY